MPVVGTDRASPPLMRLPSLAKALLILGALVGTVAGLAMALGLRLDQLPSWMITVGIYKLAFVAAAGLFVAGALLGRAARRSATRPRERNEADRVEPRIGAGQWEPGGRLTRDAERAGRPPQDR